MEKIQIAEKYVFDNRDEENILAHFFSLWTIELPMQSKVLQLTTPLHD